MSANFYGEARQKRTDEILDAGLSLICRDGLGRITMKDVATEAGISRQTLYKYFDNIDAVAYAIVNRIWKHLGAYMSDNYEASCSGAETAGEMIDALFRYAETFSSNFLFLSLFDAYYSVRPPVGELAEAYDKIVTDYTAAAGNIVRATASEGKLRNADAGETSAFIGNIVKAIASSGKLRREIDPDEATAFIGNTLIAVCQRLALLGDEGRTISAEARDSVKRCVKAAILAYLSKGF